jgi:hypothetical protein
VGAFAITARSFHFDVISFFFAHWAKNELLQSRCNPLRDAYLIIMPYLTFDFDSHASTFVGMADVSVINLHRIDGLNKICASTMDMNQVTNVHLTIGELDNPHIYPGIIVNDTADNGFS